MQPEDLSHRVRLEGSWELLEATRSQYRQLLRAARSRSWRRELPAQVATVAALHETAAEVDRALATVERLRQREAWPRDATAGRCAREVTRLRAAVRHTLRVRLRAGIPEPAGAAFTAFERRLASAESLVNAELDAAPELAGVRRLASALARALPSWSPEALDEVSEAWSEGTRALERCWERLRTADPSGAIERGARRNPRRSRERAPDDAACALVHAEVLRERFEAQLDAFIQPRLAPVRCRPDERFEVARWLMRGDEPLRAPLFSAPRVAIIELGHALARRSPSCMTATEWRSCIDAARRADSDRTDPDVPRLLEKLHTLLAARGHSGRRPLPPLYRAHGHAERFVAPSPLPGTIEEALVAARFSEAPGPRG